ncbi:glycosyltransferase family 4 protein [Parabacteroides goldsteinii]|uniref:glycosyltransferase family 4 protein n=1 Tax=Parabacteroides goldsteinii TaxID=328812 RepID=UPI00241DB426|nr:glycosyltransferase family 4 protein [Parabacteroides goldsteinii]
MKIYVFGTRGFPNIQGGVEKHCEELYTVMSDIYDITVFRRKPFIKSNNVYKKIHFIDLPTVNIKGLEAFLHSLFCTLYCIIKRPDITHIHNIGPGLFTPLLKIVGLKVVLTYHSPNYEHNKWSYLAKKGLKFCEFIATRGADKIIFINKTQLQKFNSTIQAKSVYIPNGIKEKKEIKDSSFIHSLGLSPFQYILSVGRITPEKGFNYLIKAYNSIHNKSIKLVIAGGCDHSSTYAKQLIHDADKSQVILTGYMNEEQLNHLYTYARLFVLPSFNEGYPIVLIEAINYQKPILASDIEANRSIGLPKFQYFKVGSTNDLKNKIENELNKEYTNTIYNINIPTWKEIANSVTNIYSSLTRQR